VVVQQVLDDDAQRAQHAQRAAAARVQVAPAPNMNNVRLCARQMQCVIDHCATDVIARRLSNLDDRGQRAPDVVVQLVQVHLALAARHAHLATKVVDGLDAEGGGLVEDKQAGTRVALLTASKLRAHTPGRGWR
jgi:hypothetical protein